MDFIKFKKERSILSRMFLTAFLTTSVIELANVGSGLIDGIITSRMLGATSMAAEGIAHTIFSIIGTISGLLSVGMQTMNGVSLARGNVKETQQRFSMVALLSTIVAIIFFLVIFFFSEQLAFLLGARGNAAELLDESSSYLRGLSSGSIPLILYVIFASYIQLENGSRLIQISSLLGAVTDIAFDVIAVKLGMGLFGMGLATSISSYLSLALLLTFFLKKDRMLKFDFSVLPWKELGSIFSLGSVKVFKRLANVIRPICMNAIIIGAAGVLGMSALSIQNNFINFLEIPMTGIGGATSMLIGIAYGEKSKRDCLQIGKIAHKYIRIYSVIAIVLVGLFANYIAAFYVTEPGELRDLVAFALRAAAIGIPAASWLESRINYLQASYQIKKSQLLTLSIKLFAIIPVAFICANLFGAEGVIVSSVVSNLLICLVIVIVYAVTGGKIKLPSIESYLNLPSGFSIPPQDIIELSVENTGEASLTAEQVQLFCKGHKFDSVKAYKASLCMEEVLNNVIEHGFDAKKDNRPIDVRITISEGNLIMRVRDFCRKFDITKRYEKIRGEKDITKNIGIRIIEKEALDVKYVNLAESNTLLITV